MEETGLLDASQATDRNVGLVQAIKKPELTATGEKAVWSGERGLLTIAALLLG